MSASVVVIGDILIDELLDDAGSMSVPGGSALNVAVGLAILGVPATLVGMIGDDDDGAIIRHHLAAHGVALIATIGADGTGRAASDRRDGEPQYRFNAAMRARRVEFDSEVAGLIRDARLVAISGFSFDDAEQADRLSTVLESTRGLIVIDPNPRHELIRDIDAYRRNLEKVVGHGHLLKLGSEDAELLYGASVEDAAALLRAKSPITILGTTGPGGAFVSAPDLYVARPITPDDRLVVDTMGAGDATLAVVAAAIHRAPPASREDWESVLDRAMSVAAETVRHPGALLRLPSV